MKTEDRTLLLLGLLRAQAMHGYELNQFLDEHVDYLPDVKPATVYYALERLAEQGLVQRRAEQAGNRPVRQVYEITPAGQAEFQRLLQENLTGYDPGESADDIGVAFLDAAPLDVALGALAQKREAILAARARLQEAQAQISEGGAAHLSLSRSLGRMQSDLAWVDQVVAWLQANPGGGTPSG